VLAESLSRIRPSAHAVARRLEWHPDPAAPAGAFRLGEPTKDLRLLENGMRSSAASRPGRLVPLDRLWENSREPWRRRSMSPPTAPAASSLSLVLIASGRSGTAALPRGMPVARGTGACSSRRAASGSARRRDRVRLLLQVRLVWPGRRRWVRVACARRGLSPPRTLATAGGGAAIP